MGTTFSKPIRATRHGTQNKIWYVRINYNGRRTWRSTGTEDYRQALEILKTWRTEDVVPTRQTLKGAVEEFLTTRKARCRTTSVRLYTHALNELMKRVAPTTKVSSIDTQALDSALAAYHSGGGKVKHSAVTTNGVLRVWSVFFKYLVSVSVLPTNPTAGVGKYPEEQKEILSFTAHELQRLIVSATTLHEDMGAFVTVAAYSGLRCGTLTSLKWDMVDLEAGRWRIPASAMKARRPHLCPIHPTALCVLRGAKERRPDGPVLVAPGKYDFKHALIIAGLPQKYSMHDLRRTFLNLLIEGGASLEACLTLGSWTSLDVVRKSYLAVSQERQLEALCRLGQVTVPGA
jgi:integrase